MKEIKVREYGEWTSYTYIEHITMKPLAIVSVGWERGLRGQMMGET
jgi:hypothetical protein